MKLFALSCCILVLSGCAVSLKVIDRREPSMPYKNVLVMYLHEGCDFTIFDSISYNICVQSSFAKEGSLAIRDKAEAFIANELTTSGTAVLKSSDFSGDTFNSYAGFKHLLDSAAIDAVLLIDFRNYRHTANPIPTPVAARSMNTPAFNAPGKAYKKLKAGFDCYLIPSKSLYFPVWYAEQEVEGRSAAEDNGLKHNMAVKIADALKQGGYIAH